MTESRKHPILVVDDEPDILLSLRALLRRDFDVHTAEDGSQALEEMHRHPVHVVLTDQRMPKMTGVELLSRARGECPDTVRIIFTGYADLKAVIDAVNKGEVYRYLTKPWDPDDLRAVLQEACAHYEEVAERRRLLTDLRDHLARGAALQGEAGREEWTQAGQALLARLDRVLTAPKSEK
jgi:DNA-binding NtrC family response regulator